jgi:hypothetical protein
MRTTIEKSCDDSCWDSAFGKQFMDDVAKAVFETFGDDEGNVDLCFALRVQQSRVFFHTSTLVVHIAPILLGRQRTQRDIQRVSRACCHLESRRITARHEVLHVSWHLVIRICAKVVQPEKKCSTQEEYFRSFLEAS